MSRKKAATKAAPKRKSKASGASKVEQALELAWPSIQIGARFLLDGLIHYKHSESTAVSEAQGVRRTMDRTSVFKIFSLLLIVFTVAGFGVHHVGASSELTPSASPVQTPSPTPSPSPPWVFVRSIKLPTSCVEARREMLHLSTRDGLKKPGWYKCVGGVFVPFEFGDSSGGGSSTGCTTSAADVLVKGTGGAITALTVTTPGTGYAVSDVVTISQSGSSDTAQVTVTSIDGSGGITGFTITTPGTAYSIGSADGDFACGPCAKAVFNITTVSAIGDGCTASRAFDAGSAGRFAIDTDTGNFLAGDLTDVTSSNTVLEVKPQSKEIALHGSSIQLGRRNEGESHLDLRSPSGGSGGSALLYALGDPGGNSQVQLSPSSAVGGMVLTVNNFGSSTDVKIHANNVVPSMPAGSITTNRPLSVPHVWQGDFSLAESGDRTSTTTTLANTGLGTLGGSNGGTLRAGATYSFTATLFVESSVPGDGLKFDFGGGTIAAPTNFRAYVVCVDEGGFVFRASVTALTTTFGNPVVTGPAQVEIRGTITPATNGTLRLRFAQDSHSSGTLSLRRGSFLIIDQATEVTP